jgi:transcriptional regulator with XRE-family HTH domain
MDARIALEDSRRREFAAFLRSRRERLTPADVGLSEGFRRRTPGLRREEVALLAGVGATWYTWLEQGRDVRPSPEVLAALARALKLDAAERHHLFRYVTARRPSCEHPDQRLCQRRSSGCSTACAQPAYVLGRRWDVLAWNPAAVAVFGDYGSLGGDRRNIMHMVFADPDHRKLLVDWDELARAVLAMFRSDSARYTGDPDFERLIACLRVESAEFRDWWDRHEVLRPITGHKRIDHPAVGPMLFEYTSLAVAEPPDMKLVVYTRWSRSGPARSWSGC